MKRNAVFTGVIGLLFGVGLAGNLQVFLPDSTIPLCNASVLTLTAICVSALTMITRYLWSRTPLYLLVGGCVGLYLFVWVVWLDGKFTPSASETLAVALELGLLLGIVALASYLARALADSNDPRGQAELDETASSNELKRWLMQCRRHGWPLSAIVVQPITQKTHIDTDELWEPASDLRSEARRVVRGILRRTDLLVGSPGRNNRLVVVCPNLGPQSGRTMANRLRDELVQNAGFRVQCGLASFPNDALTFEDLIRKAEYDAG